MTKNPSIVIHIDGGVCEYKESKGVKVFFFDWDNLELEDSLDTLDNFIRDAKRMPRGFGKRDTVDRLLTLRGRLEESLKFKEVGHV